MKRYLWVIAMAVLFTGVLVPDLSAQRRKKTSSTVSQETKVTKTSYSGVKFRSIGPALTSGRIADFAVNPAKNKEYYVASAAGGVWKTSNSGVTFTPVFDHEGSFSIGCIQLDPNNSNVVWVGTGENNNQRSVDYGDGVYRSEDGGVSWKNMGLKNSEHIGRIVIDPRNSLVVYIAAIGPLWSSGGDRGVYKSTDGGQSWNAVLTVDENTGANDLVMDPRNPDILYASTLQRRRHVFTYIGGGPGSAIYKSMDAGATWTKITKGLPGEDLGRIGLAISQADPEKIYAIVEAANGKGGFFRSTNRGISWEKRSGFATSGNYYQEIFADPVNPDKVYAMNNWMRVTTDGGKTFHYVGEDFKHIDNHVMWIDPRDTDHLLNGNDGGVYETWDGGKHWDFKANLPVTQFYKVALDNNAPFYNVYGGTQDNFSIGGPSRSISGNGIANSEWFITSGGDGFESQVDPNNPDIVYAQSQYGGLVRYDKKSGESIGIKPMARKNENNYRWNWDAPLVVSKHKEGRLFFAANKVFRSDDYGDSWEVISKDITAQIDRNTLKVMGRTWSVDAVMKNGSTSPYGTIVTLDESPLDENLLMAGTDDGLIQISDDGGNKWQKASQVPGVPANTYVNMLLPSLHDKNTLYACFNDHKRGNFKPYVYVTKDLGKTWNSITSDLPVRGSTFAIAEDHVDPDLLFVGTEFGAFFSTDQGKHWVQFKGGLPVAAIRDIAIQRRENDLVLASFGRGFFILDDYSFLRHVSDATLDQEGVLFASRDAWQFEYSYPLGLPKQSFQGDNYYLGQNLGSEVIFTYYLKKTYKSKKKQRQETEAKLRKAGKDVRYPTYAQLKAENDEKPAYLLFEIKDSDGAIIKRLKSSIKKGVHRINWDLRYDSKVPVTFSKPAFYNPFGGSPTGPKVDPGEYTESMFEMINGVKKRYGESQKFNVKSLDNKVLPTKDKVKLAVFQQKVNTLNGIISGTSRALEEVRDQIKYIRAALLKMGGDQSDLSSQVNRVNEKLDDLRQKIGGDRLASRLDMGRPPSIRSRIRSVLFQSLNSTSGPTKNHEVSFSIALEEFKPVLAEAKELIEKDMATLNAAMVKAGAPYTPGTLPSLEGLTLD